MVLECSFIGIWSVVWSAVRCSLWGYGSCGRGAEGRAVRGFRLVGGGDSFRPGSWGGKFRGDGSVVQAGSFCLGENEFLEIEPVGKKNSQVHANPQTVLPHSSGILLHI